MAEKDSGSVEVGNKKEDQPEYLKEVSNVKFLNISIKGYEKKTSASGFSKEEYYAYHIVSMWAHY